MNKALFFNGVPEEVLTEILEAQIGHAEGELFLQKGRTIKLFENRLPKPNSPIRLYISTTKRLSTICYTAEIIQWEDKRVMSQHRQDEVLHYLKTFQPKERNKFLEREKAFNLITIRNLRSVETLLPTSFLKKEDGSPLGKMLSPGWAEVYDFGDLAAIELEEISNRELVNEITKAKSFDTNTLEQRLKAASKIPERVLIISVGYRRNADVIVATLNRANGICERCGKKAPFLRKSGGTPFLEVHHRTPLADGGEDTIENAVALCPNCHREAHYG